MKAQHVSRIAVVVVTAVLSSRAWAADVTQADREAVEDLIRAQVGSGRSADDQPVVEYPEGRRILVGSGAKRGTSVVVAQYTIETGNTWQIYVAVLDKKSHRRLATGRVGGKGYRGVTLKSVADGVLELAAEFYGAGDAMCCPSVRGTSWFEVRDGQLWETDTKVQCHASHRPGRP
jgi:hypothetical protein